MGREGVSDEMGRVTNGKVLAFGGVEVQPQSLDQLALLLREFWRISWRFREAISLASSA